MGRTLILTSPAMEGEDVIQTQRLMLGLDGSPYHVWDGPVSGIYGSRTADGVYHGKYVLGYPMSELDRMAGDMFRGLLRTSVAELPEDYQQRRQVRLNPPDKPARQLALARAVSQIGRTESPAGSNRQPYGEWFGWNGVSWCAIFQTWCWEPYAPQTFVKGSRYAYVPSIHRDAMAHRYGLSIVTTPIPGDLVLYYWRGYHVDETESHIGVFESGSATSWTAIEGNTSSSSGGSQGNGGMVARKERSPASSAEHVFVRVT